MNKKNLLKLQFNVIKSSIAYQLKQIDAVLTENRIIIYSLDKTGIRIQNTIHGIVTPSVSTLCTYVTFENGFIQQEIF